MRNPTRMESPGMESPGMSPADSSADLQDARRVCVDLGRQGETIAELVVPLLRQATQELTRLEAQREELRKPGVREAQQGLLPKLLERIEELGQTVKRLERASRGLKELISSLGNLGEQLQGGLARRDEELRELEAIAREEKRMWLRELQALREQVGGQERTGGSSLVQQEAQQRLRSENEALPKLRAERDRLAQRVAELEKSLLAREQTLSAKEQTIEDLRRMIVLLTGEATSPASPKQPAPPPPTPRSLPDPIHLVPLTPTRPPPKPPKPPDQLFGSSTMQLANNLLETLGVNAPVSAPPVAERHEPPMQRVPSMEIMLGPLDELEPPPPSLPPPVPALPPVPTVPTVTPASTMPRASARHASAGSAKTPPPIPPATPRRVERPGTLVVSEDMFNEMLLEQRPPVGSGRK